MDRSMTLMMKDMMGGRFQAMMHVQFHEEPAYEPDNLDRFWDVLQEGDGLLCNYGNMAYTAIKKVEGLALERMHQLASLMKPRLPVLSRFREHLERACLNQENDLPGSLRFSQMILDQSDIQIFLTIYGSFRLWGIPLLNTSQDLRSSILLCTWIKLWSLSMRGSWDPTWHSKCYIPNSRSIEDGM